MFHVERSKKLAVLLTWWNGWRPLYRAEHVRAMARMLRAYLDIPHSIYLLTDQKTSKTETEVDEILPIPEEPRNASPGKGGVRCFRRLRYFDSAYTKRFDGEWLMSLDLDALLLPGFQGAIEAGMTDFGFAIIRGRLAVQRGQRPYNGSLYLIRQGQHQHIWDDFDWQKSPQECYRSGWVGSDQVWLSLHLQGAPTLGPEHGVYFYQQYLDSEPESPEATVIHYAGLMKPWSRRSEQETPELWREYKQWLD